MGIVGRRFLAGSVAGGINRISAILYGLVVLPLGIGHFGPLAFGAWLTLTSVMSYMTTGSLGMPLAVLGAVSRSSGHDAAASIVRRAFGLVSISAATIAAALVAIALGWPETLDWLADGAIPSTLLARILLVMGLGIALSLPLTVFPAALGGQQRVVAQNLYEASRSGLRVVAMVITVWLGGDLLLLALLTALAEVLPGVAALVHVTLGSRRLRMHRAPVERSSERLVSSGLRFLLLQFEMAVITNTDFIIINATVGAASVTGYAGPWRAYQAASALIAGLLSPAWPAYGHAYARGAWRWIADAHDRVRRISVSSAGLVWVAGVAVLPQLLRAWLGDDFPVDDGILFMLGGYVFFFSLIAVNGVLLNAMDATRTQSLVLGVEAVVNVILSVVLARTFGVRGVAAGTLIASVCVSSWWLGLEVRRRTLGRVDPGFTLLLVTALYTVPLAVLVTWVAPLLPSGASASVRALGVGAYVIMALFHHRRRLGVRLPPVPKFPNH